MREMCQTFGITALGETVESWTLENEFLTAEVLTYGATLRRLVFGGVDVVLGYDTLSEYERNDGFLVRQWAGCATESAGRPSD